MLSWKVKMLPGLPNSELPMEGCWKHCSFVDPFAQQNNHGWICTDFVVKWQISYLQEYQGCWGAWQDQLAFHCKKKNFSPQLFHNSCRPDWCWRPGKSVFAGDSNFETAKHVYISKIDWVREGFDARLWTCISQIPDQFASLWLGKHQI